MRTAWMVDTLMTKDRLKPVKIRDDEIVYGKQGGPLAGASATVDAVSATRLGLFRLREHKDRRQLYLNVEGEGFAFCAEIKPKYGAITRKFAARVNAQGEGRPGRGA